MLIVDNKSPGEVSTFDHFNEEQEGGLDSISKSINIFLNDPMSHLNDEQKKSARSLLQELKGSIEILNERGPDYLSATSIHMEEAINREKDPAVQSIFFSKFTELVEQYPEFSPLMEEVTKRRKRRHTSDAQAKNNSKAKEWSSEFLEKNKDTYDRLDEKQAKDLQKLLSLFSNCIEYLYNKPTLEQKAASLVLQINGLNGLNSKKVSGSLSSRLNEFIILHPETSQIIDVMNSMAGIFLLEHDKVIVKEQISQFTAQLKPNPATSLSEPSSESVPRALGRGTL